MHFFGTFACSDIRRDNHTCAQELENYVRKVNLPFVVRHRVCESPEAVNVNAFIEIRSSQPAWVNLENVEIDPLSGMGNDLDAPKPGI